MDEAVGGSDRVPELPGSGAGRPQDTASSQNEEVFWAWHSLFVSIYGLITASINVVYYQTNLYRIPVLLLFVLHSVWTRKKHDSLPEATATFWNVLMSDKHEIISKSLVYVLNVQHIDLGKMSPVI